MGKRTSVHEQRRLVARWRTTALSMDAFARRHCVHPTTFDAWGERHRLDPMAAAEPPDFLQVAVVPPPESLSVYVGGHALRFDAPPPAAWFAAVVRELSPC